MLLLLLCAQATAVRAQEAVVLSGGGSRGLAHAGVLLGLEQLGHDPDIVVGTSMGAIVGALYAAGYEPDEIRRRILSIRWAELFTPTPVTLGPDRAVLQPMLTIDRDAAGFRASRGVVGQWRINRELVRLLLDANMRSRGDFDRLPRRYRAVAADLETGEAVVLASGDLARAVRASMAVPGFFAPVEWNGRVLVDGGIADNLPTALARRLGATHVIASDVSLPPAKIHSLAPLAVVARALDLMSHNAQLDSVQPNSLVLPAIDPSMSAANFAVDAATLIDAGLAAALRDITPRTPAAAVTRSETPAPRSFAGLRVDATHRSIDLLARRAFNDVLNTTYDAALMEHAIDDLYSTGLFEGIWPTVIDSASVTAPLLALRLDVVPQSSFSAAGGYDSDRGGRAWLSVDRLGSLNNRPTVFTVAASAGGLSRSASLSSRIYSLTKPGIAWTAGVHVREHSVRAFEEDVIRTNETVRAGGWLALEFPRVLRERSAFIGLRSEWIDVEDTNAGWASGPVMRYGDVETGTRVVGVPLLIEAEARRGDVSYNRFAFGISKVIAFNALVIAPLVDVRATSDDAPEHVKPALGDEHMIPGLRWGELRGAARVVTGVDIAHPIALGHIRVRMRTGGVGATAAVDAVADSRWGTGAELGMVWQSAIGLVEVGYGRATRSDGRFDINIGRSF